MLIEDDPEIGGLIGDVLRAEGYRVALAASERQALAALGAGSFDLVLTDALADFDSRAIRGAALERILAAAGSVPVILCTAHNREHFAANRFAGIIAKPFDLDDLLGPINALFAAPTCGD